MTGVIRTEKHGAVGSLIIDHAARRNALTAQMWRALPAAVASLDDDPQVRVIVMRGAGEQAFVSGADISQFQEMRVGATAQQYEAENALAFAALSGVDKPLIALIHGFCIGGGVALAICADLRFAADDATFAVPAARLGLGYPLASMARLVPLLGAAHAYDLCFTARRVDADEARRIGLVNEVYLKADLDAQVEKIALGIANNAPLTLRAFKEAIRELSKADGARDLTRASEAIDDCFASTDYREGIDAFLAKRRPSFRGQ
jgi:enoyl-CoA hydratase/carnithine racemase